ncbi:MAG TPA: class I SAM-dependent RNA methyltransferase [Cyclobacteriaceae bacterium]|nr:class I SAM-dependent RNA methyltransferase [Cyclobacteriaceae bacterium]
MDFNKQSKVIITCNKRLAPILEGEVKELGFTPTKVFATGVELKVTLKDCIKLNLNLRSASQILCSLRQFRVRNPDDLYKEVLRFPWETVIDRAGYFSVTSHVDHFTVNNPLFVNVKIKDAIVDRFRRETGVRPNSGPELDKTVVHVYWKDDVAELFIDTSGETLAKHGYRKIPGKAPMLEALASSTILASKWDRRSTFVNPMCGSGTLAIEAALIATGRKPGLFRNNYSFMHVVGFEKENYEDEFMNLKKAVEDREFRIIATDISPDAIDISKVNAKMAGVDHLIEFAICDFEETEVPEAKGVIFLNPEYGERLGESSELEKTYERIGDFLKKKCKGYTGYIFTGNLDLAKKIGLKASRRIEFYSAKLDCRLLEYELYEGTRRAQTIHASEPSPG